MNVNILRPNRRALLLGLAATAIQTPSVLAQGFAGMGQAAEGFALPDPDYRFVFPADHGPHPQFRIEWWYVTANLIGADGRDYGVQWTLFRSALTPEAEVPGWRSNQAWMGHAALTTPTQHFATERLARGGIGQAGVTAAPFTAWIDEWTLTGETLNTVQMRAAGPDFAYDLALSTQAPFVPQGDQGYSVKSPAGQASHYYSQPFYAVEGTLMLPEGDMAVTGRAWLDREWSSQPLEGRQTGWDWFSLHFTSGDKLMGALVRADDQTPFSFATWIAADATPTHMPDGAFQARVLSTTQVAGRPVPTSWQVTLAARGVDVTVEAMNTQAWMPLSFPYWEGPVRISGSHEGVGYLEMTGYV